MLCEVEPLPAFIPADPVSTNFDTLRCGQCVLGVLGHGCSSLQRSGSWSLECLRKLHEHAPRGPSWYTHGRPHNSHAWYPRGCSTPFTRTRHVYHRTSHSRTADRAAHRPCGTPANELHNEPYNHTRQTIHGSNNPTHPTSNEQWTSKPT